MLEIDYTHKKYRVHKVPMLLDNKGKLKEDLLKYVDLFRPGHKVSQDHVKQMGKKGRPGPGIQLGLQYSDADSISSLNKHFSNKVLEYHNQVSDKKAIETYTNAWTFISTPDNRETNYHDHVTFSPQEAISSSYTWTYYLQVPNNCSGDEGKLFFSPTKNDSDSISLFPEEDSLYIFPGTLSHRPELNPNSTNNRIVLAGNTFLIYKDKTLF
jgi:hypothetical protein|tara:strand:- start:1068 stop:1703 length:636 start_codon:yes stop_codon:yes gene_type:complete